VPASGDTASWALSLGLCCAVGDWFAVARDSRRMEYLLKPATLAFYVAAAWALGSGDGHLRAWFVPALVLSLIGDIFLMLPGTRWFLPGLVTFLAGHLCYIVGLNRVPPPIQASVLLVPALAMAAAFLPRLVRGAERQGRGNLKWPVVGYGVVLSLMLMSAWATWFRLDWSVGARLAACAGGTLFYASDLMLAWFEFVRRSKALQVAVIVTYHVGQLVLVLVVGLYP